MNKQLIACLVLVNLCAILSASAEIQFNFIPGSNDIQVRLSVQPDICGTTNPPYNATYFLSDVVPGSSLFDVMVQAEPLGLTFNYTTFPDLGAYITTINGLFANDTLHQYWGLLDGWTGQLLPVGASSYKPIDGDHIVFKLSLF